MSDQELVKEKVAQSTDLLQETDTDLWITFGRETTEIDEPCLPLLLGFDIVWPTMVLLTKTGEKHVIIGRHDAPNARDLDIYDVHAYDESFEPVFVELLEDIDPDEIAVNYSRDNNIADGLTHGLYLLLTDALEGTGYEDHLVSSSDLVSRLRSEKSPIERDRMVRAAEITEELFSKMSESWEPDWSEADVADFIHDHMTERGLDSAWSWDYCPTVHAGGASELGHTMAGDLKLPQGEVLHTDFGVKYKGYATDIQRLYYYPENGDEPPEELAQAYSDVRAAIDAAFDVMAPGVTGHEVDDAARKEITERGWSEFKHAVGHNVGRNAHDGGTLLGPKWDRYGTSPDGIVREGEIYTLELGVETEWGYLGQEEMVEVTSDGVEYFVEPQTEFRILEP
ncbi:M24 family metallopeptidase [Natronosalvus halobius]|uniref:M24 family metallopeptidase n=1 Tax=Natronosalvus halobius TaxID=2953746 RepID=UPI0020A06981|nr:M24 family metallopeptidase [Natronosalvus halobius]USZ73681.1 aminopeptidase P family protein [Natronosalvus halobius]